MERIRIRRDRPGIAASVIALAVTALFVYLIARGAMGANTRIAASAEKSGAGDVRMEGMEVTFICDGRYSSYGEARIAAAQCARDGGAGLVLEDNGAYLAVRDTAGAYLPEDGVLLERSCTGVTLRISGSAGQIASVAQAVDVLRALACETGSMAENFEDQGHDPGAVYAMLNVYRTRAKRAAEHLPPCAAGDMMAAAVASAVERIDSALDDIDTGKIKLIHAAGCADWISLVNGLIALTDV